MTVERVTDMDVEELRVFATHYADSSRRAFCLRKAADRIEALEAELSTLRMKLITAGCEWQEQAELVADLREKLSALPPPPAGDGALVPRVATEEMLEAGMGSVDPYDLRDNLVSREEWLSLAWSAMLAAAPHAGKEG